MNWEVVTAMTEAIAAVAVVASLVYLGLQTRNGMIEDRARTIHDMSVEFTNWQMAIAADPALTKIWVNGVGDCNSLNQVEKAQFILCAGAVCRIQENVFLRFQAGRLSKTIWRPYALRSVAS